MTSNIGTGLAIFGTSVLLGAGGLVAADVVSPAAPPISSIELFARWMQAGGTLGVVGVLLWVRSEEKTRREKDELRRDAQDSEKVKREKEQQDRYDKVLERNQVIHDRLAVLAQDMALRLNGLESAMRHLRVETRLFQYRLENPKLSPEESAKVLALLTAQEQQPQQPIEQSNWRPGGR